jgi:TRAP transporter TAXI family solute receptor
LLPIEGAQAQALRNTSSFFAVDNVPAATYKDVDAVNTLSVGAQWVTSAKADTETIYQITKALYSESTQKALAAGHAKGKLITLKNAVQGAGIPFHPGAEKYYREAGVLK